MAPIFYLMKAYLVLALFCVPILAGCDQTPPTGKLVRIQLRRGDALGAASSLPISPRTYSINGVDTALSGKISKVTDDWVVLDASDAPLIRIWIPRSNILLIEYPPH